MPRATRIALAAALLALPGAGSRAQALDAVSAEAARSLDADVRAYRRSCPGEAITVSVQPAQVSPAVVARIVSLAAGSCFGQPGQNAYLLAKGPRGWERVLSAEPGFIEAQSAREPRRPGAGLPRDVPLHLPVERPRLRQRRVRGLRPPCQAADGPVAVRCRAGSPVGSRYGGPPGCSAPEASRNDETLEPRCR